MRFQKGNDRLSDYIYDPTKKKMVRKVRKRRKRERWDIVPYRHNWVHYYPGYLFTVNGVGYICVDGGDTPPEQPIPFKVYPMEQDRGVHIKQRWKGKNKISLRKAGVSPNLPMDVTEDTPPPSELPLENPI